MFSACFSSLRAAAKEGDKGVCLLILKAIGEVEWRYYLDEVGAISDLSEDIITVLGNVYPFWSSSKVKDTHLLALILAKVNARPFSLNLLLELVDYPKNREHRTQWRNCAHRVRT
jgi:hypothetical protein